MSDVSDDSAFDLAGFDRYVDEQGISDEDYPEAFARWIAKRLEGHVPRLVELGTPSDLRARKRPGRTSHAYRGRGVLPPASDTPDPGSGHRVAASPASADGRGGSGGASPIKFGSLVLFAHPSRPWRFVKVGAGGRASHHGSRYP